MQWAPLVFDLPGAFCFACFCSPDVWRGDPGEQVETSGIHCFKVSSDALATSVQHGV